MSNGQHREPFIILIADDKIENIISLEEILAADKRIFLRATSGNETLKHALKNETNLICITLFIYYL